MPRGLPALLSANAPVLAKEGQDWGWNLAFFIVLGLVILGIGWGLWYWFKKHRSKQEPI